MLQHVVTNRAQLIAAIRASAKQTFAEAKKNPVHIQCGTANYAFKEGIQEHRGEQIIKTILATSKKAFDVPEVLL